MQQCQSLRTSGRFSLEDRLSKPISSSCPKIISLFHALKEGFNQVVSCEDKQAISIQRHLIHLHLLRDMVKI